MKVSIIIPVYNVEKYIEQCLVSVMNQTYKNIEVIVVNDGTMDNSIEIAKKITGNDIRFVYVNKENGGLSDARNFGLRFATGDFVSFIDSDDYVDINYIKKMVISLENSSNNMVVTGVMLDKLGKLHTKSKWRNYTVDTTTALHNQYINETSIPFTCAWGKLVPRSWYEEVQFPVGKIHEDEYTTYKLYLKSSGVSFVDEPLYYYRIRENSIMTQSKSLKNLSIFEALEERIEIFKVKNISLVDTLICYYRYLQLFKIKLNKKDLFEVKETLKNKEKWINQQLKHIPLNLKQRLKLIVFKYFKSYYFKNK